MTAHFEALGLMLLHFCWQGALIAAGAKLLDLALPGLRAQSRYTLHLCALMLMTLAALATFAFEDIRLSQIYGGAYAVPAFEPVLITTGLPTGLTMTQALPWLDALWALGVLLLSLRTLSGLWGLQQLAKDALPVPSDLAERFERTLRLNGLASVRLRLHPGIDGPFVVGVFRSVVYLPLSVVSALTPDQLDAVLGHELEHIRRADFAWNLLQNAVETLFFYHPAVWWLSRTLRDQRELACDDAAVRGCRDPLTYATALLNLEEQRRHSRAPDLAMALNGHDGGPSLLSRIGRILGDTSMTRRKSAAPRPFVLIVPLVLATLAAITIPAAQVAAGTNETPKGQCKIKATEATRSGTLSEPSPPALADRDATDNPVASDEAPAAEATDADVEPKNFWSGLRPAAAHDQDDAIHSAKVWKSQAFNMQAAWSGWAEKAQAWAHEAGKVDAAEIAQVRAEALAEAAEEMRRSADELRLRNDVNAAEMDREAAKVAAEAKQAQADAERAQKNAERDARRATAQAALIPDAPLPPEAPEPMAPLAPPAPPAPVAPLAVVPAAPVVPKVMVKATRRSVVMTRVMSSVTLNQLPIAVAMAIPAPDVKTDVVVHVKTQPNVQVVLAR